MLPLHDYKPLHKPSRPISRVGEINKINCILLSYFSGLFSNRLGWLVGAHKNKKITNNKNFIMGAERLRFEEHDNFYFFGLARAVEQDQGEGQIA